MVYKRPQLTHFFDGGDGRRRKMGIEQASLDDGQAWCCWSVRMQSRTEQRCDSSWNVGTRSFIVVVVDSCPWMKGVSMPLLMPILTMRSHSRSLHSNLCICVLSMNVPHVIIPYRAVCTCTALFEASREGPSFVLRESVASPYSCWLGSGTLLGLVVRHFRAACDWPAAKTGASSTAEATRSGWAVLFVT